MDDCGEEQCEDLQLAAVQKQRCNYSSVSRREVEGDNLQPTRITSSVRAEYVVPQTTLFLDLPQVTGGIPLKQHVVYSLQHVGGVGGCK